MRHGHAGTRHCVWARGPGVRSCGFASDRGFTRGHRIVNRNAIPE
jgi:hypothetical protein